MGVPKDGVIRLRHDPMETFKQLAFTLMGLFGVVGIVAGAIYLHGESIDTEWDPDASAASAEPAPEATPGPAQPMPAAAADELLDENLTLPP